MNKNKKVKKVNKEKPVTALPTRIFLIITNLIGFPMFILAVGLTCKYYADTRIYTGLIYVPLLLAFAMWGVTALIQFLIYNRDRKIHRSFKHTILSCTAVPLCCLAGLFLILDIVLPPLLTGATSGTIKYEHLVENAKGQNEIFKEKAHRFMYKNGMFEKNEFGEPIDNNGKVIPSIKIDYDKNGKAVMWKTHDNPNGVVIGTPEGSGIRLENEELIAMVGGTMLNYNEYNKLYTNYMNSIRFFEYYSEENQNIFKPIFASFDQAYNLFNGLALDCVLGGDALGDITSGAIPLTALITIILRTAPGNESDPTLSLAEILLMNKDLIENAIEGLIASGLNFSATGKNLYSFNDEMPGLAALLDSVVVTKNCNGISWSVLQLDGSGLLSNCDPNANIYYNKGEANETRVGGCLGYQDMAWLNSLSLLGIITCLMDCRDLFYIFGVYIAMLTYITYLAKKRYLLANGEVINIIPLSNKRREKIEKKGYYFATVINPKQIVEINDEDEMPKKKLGKKAKSNKTLAKNTTAEPQQVSQSVQTTSQQETVQTAHTEPRRTAPQGRPTGKPISKSAKLQQIRARKNR